MVTFLTAKWYTFTLPKTNLGSVAYAQGDYVAARALYEESLSMRREMGDKQGMAYALLGLGLVDLAENKQEAGGRILDSLRLRVKIGERLAQTSSLVGVAGVAWQAGDGVEAVRLLGAIESALKMLKVVLGSDVVLFYRQMLAAVQSELSAEAFAQAWAEGEQMDLDTAVVYALQGTITHE